MKSKNVIEINNLHKSFGQTTVVDGISFNVQAGDVFGFLGPNGAGKTTTIRMMLGLVYPDSGTIKINEHDMEKDFLNAISQVGAMVETPKFYPYLTGYQNLSLIANLHPTVQTSRIDEVLDMVSLSSRARDRVGTYSLGMKQRLGIARALLNRPDIVFLDEPTNGLDPQGIREIREMISRLALEQDITFFISTHLLHEVEQVCSKVAILNKGQLIARGSVKELLGQDNEMVKVRTTDTAKALEILKGIEYIRSVKPSPGGLEIELEKDRSAALNQLLVSGGVQVDYLMPQNQSLEQFFIELTEGGHQVA
ncbi:MAG: ABC transporter ATP-binding protein [Firmicutes bacterium]|nr:ABC transporter ATP-binding protein [Bacillota bacterium]